MKYPDSKILVFCKAPLPGTVNTRLLSVLSASEAAVLHEKLARRILDCCLDSKLANIELWCSPDTSHNFFREYSDRGIPLFQQQGADIGERMCQGALHSLADGGIEKVMIIGTDLPTLDSDYLEDALEKLVDHDVVLGPAEDGGYGLIGFKQVRPEIFKNMAWSTDEVCAETCRRLDSLGDSCSLLPLLWDVDRPGDLKRMARRLTQSGQ